MRRNGRILRIVRPALTVTYGRGTLDDKDNVVASLMTMLTLKRLNVPLDRDVIFLAESGEEGSTRVGIQFMVNRHLADIDAEHASPKRVRASAKAARCDLPPSRRSRRFRAQWS